MLAVALGVAAVPVGEPVAASHTTARPTRLRPDLVNEGREETYAPRVLRLGARRAAKRIFLATTV